jgi:hypothetical protein
MSGSSSDEHSRAIDELPEDTVIHTTESMQAEIAYRQERIRHDFRRAGWFSRAEVRSEAKPPRVAERSRWTRAA